MKLLLQRVNQASVEVNQEIIASIGKGYVIMVGIGKDDTKNVFQKAIEKVVKLRLFANKDAKFDKVLDEVKGQVLLISQFTLFADTSKGNRPYFGGALEPKKAKQKYKLFVEMFKNKLGERRVQTGEFAAYMKVEIENDGPVTIPLAF